MARILIIDDDQAFRDALAETLVSLGHTAVQYGSAQEGFGELKRSPCDVVFLDYRMPDLNGLEALVALKAQIPEPPPVVMLTAYARGDNTIDAMKLGAFDHLSKPVSRDTLRDTLNRALRSTPVTHATAEQAQHGDLIGISSAMREIQKRVGLAAASDAPVLLLGETGSGKESVAQALHRHSSRTQQPFIAVNCAAIPHELLESELFGHVRGAFTGAASDRPGCFRAASGGVLLLDEIGDMALNVQAKILRVLQEGKVTPVGSNQAIAVDVRLIAATHQDLYAAVRNGRFREDLLYRLNVLPIHVPPLRERLADIIPLAEHFLVLASRGQRPKGLSVDAAQRLVRHPWPGNVRELKNLMERCQVMVRYPVISAEDLAEVWGADKMPPPEKQPTTLLENDMPTAVARLERLMIQQAMTLCGGNRTEMARRLGIHRQLLYRKLKQFNLE